MDNQFLSAALWGGTPDSEGEPSYTISALLHFLSLQLPVPEGVCKSIPTFGEEGGGGTCFSSSQHQTGGLISGLFILIA